MNEQKQCIQSAHSVNGMPKLTTTTNTTFNADQHKHCIQTPHYYYPKRLSAIEILAKQYSSSLTRPNSTGLLWYNASQSTVC